MRTNDPGSWWIHNQRLYTCGEVVTHICVYMGEIFSFLDPEFPERQEEI